MKPDCAAIAAQLGGQVPLASMSVRTIPTRDGAQDRFQAH
jgi:hypothetical protein